MNDDETDPIHMTALEWFVRIKDEKVSADEKRDFAVWLAADPAHAKAYERAQALWNRFDIVKPPYQRLRKTGQIGRRSLLLGGLAAVVVAPAAYVLSWPEILADHSTGIGERKLVTLADGSTVELGSYSALSVDFTARERRLTLHRGQGFFTVAPDAARPFVVDAGAGSTRALGTQFDIKLLDDAVTVAVIEHSVSLQLPSANALVIEQGWQVSYDGADPAPAQRIDVDGIQAWRQDRIVFEDVPLRIVLRELERYRRGRIILMDDSIGDIAVTAIFDTRKADAALGIIAQTLPVRVVNPDGILAIVYRR
jgi:transmembrane sensor